MYENILLSLAETVGIGTFLVFLIRGLKAKIASLEGVVTVQNQTLEVMEKRIEETEKVGNIYKRLMADLPADLQNYKTIMSITKDDIILELKNSNEEKEKRIRALREGEARLKESKAERAKRDVHLRILKNLVLGNPKEPWREKLDLLVLSELGGRRIEDGVPALASSKTAQEYLASLGYDLSMSEERPNPNAVFGDKNNPPERKYEVGYASVSITGWFVVRDNELTMNTQKLKDLENEFRTVRTVEM